MFDLTPAVNSIMLSTRNEKRQRKKFLSQIAELLNHFVLGSSLQPSVAENETQDDGFAKINGRSKSGEISESHTEVTEASGYRQR